VVVLVFAACATETDPDENPDPVPCEALFGAPSVNTGLTGDQCAPSCACEDLDFAPPAYSEEDIAALAVRELASPPSLLESDPYDAPDDHPQQPDLYCAVHPEGAISYRLETHDTLESIDDSDGTLTHHGDCGQCSSLQDLAVYMAMPDLSDPVRECAMLSLGGTVEDVAFCLEELGFSAACAQIWAYNSVNTREMCLDVCLAALDEPYHVEDGSLNDCIQCDEDLSGPVFKAVAGRTRRNSGLPTALCRPCDSVAPVIHVYP